MQKTILLTGGTDGIGLETAKRLLAKGHHVLLHGRNPDKLAEVERSLAALAGGGGVEPYIADLTDMADVMHLARALSAKHRTLDALINNAGVFKTAQPITASGLDVRFVVNTLAPYLLTQQLLPLMDGSGRVVNLSSAAQAPVSKDALMGKARAPDDFTAYAQSKLAITMWTRAMAQKLGRDGPIIVAVNPGSLLGTKMVREGFGTSGNDIGIGADILCRAVLSNAFNDASGRYFDNDAGGFAEPHPDAQDLGKCDAVVAWVDAALSTLT